MKLQNGWAHNAALAASICLGLGTASVAEAQLFDIPGSSVDTMNGLTVTLDNVRFAATYSNVGHVFAGSYPSASYSYTATGTGDPMWAVFSWGPTLFGCGHASPGGGGSGSGPASVPWTPGIYYLKARLTQEEFCGEHVPAGSEHQTPDNAAAVLVVWPNVDVPSFVDVKPEPAGENCAHGGQTIIVGRATKQNNAVNNPSFATTYVCNGASGQDGPAGQNGANSLVVVSDEAAGANCALGGTRIQTGLDLNENGQLDDGNVATSYVCNGADGADGADGTDGANSLVLVSDEPAGDNCAVGGRKIETGVDLNSNGLLDDDNVTTSYVCHGAAGRDSVVSVSEEPAGENCATGGTRIASGLDLNGNGQADDANVSTTFVCNGAGGADGADGATGSDGADGKDGADGANGADGADGKEGAAGKKGADGGCSVGGSSSASAGLLWFGLMAGLVLRRRRRC